MNFATRALGPLVTKAALAPKTATLEKHRGAVTSPSVGDRHADQWFREFLRLSDGDWAVEGSTGQVDGCGQPNDMAFCCERSDKMRLALAEREALPTGLRSTAATPG